MQHKLFAHTSGLLRSSLPGHFRSLFIVTTSDVHLDGYAFESTVTAKHTAILFKRPQYGAAAETCVIPQAGIFGNVFLMCESAFGTTNG